MFPGPQTQPQIIYPLIYSTCVQRLAETGAWVFPNAEDGTWLCVRPASSA
jgi:hypothetical protein